MADNYYKTKKGFIGRIYNNQVRHSKDRGHRPPEYSQKDLREWMMSQKEFHELYAEYKASGFLKELAPSINRKCNDVHYCLSNVELMSWSDNLSLSRVDRRSGADGVGRPIVKLSLDGEELEEYVTIAEAGRNLHSSARKGIQEVLSGRNKTAYGYKWAYKDESQEV